LSTNWSGWLIETNPRWRGWADDVFTIHPGWLFEYGEDLKRRRLKVPFECVSPRRPPEPTRGRNVGRHGVTEKSTSGVFTAKVSTRGWRMGRQLVALQRRFPLLTLTEIPGRRRASAIVPRDRKREPLPVGVALEPSQSPLHLVVPLIPRRYQTRQPISTSPQIPKSVATANITNC